jgi:hypothetical protein
VGGSLSLSIAAHVLASRRIGLTEKIRIRIPNKYAPAKRRPAGRSNVRENFKATLAAAGRFRRRSLSFDVGPSKEEIVKHDVLNDY